MFHEVTLSRELNGYISYEIAVPADWRARAFAAGWRFDVSGRVEVEHNVNEEPPPAMEYKLTLAHRRLLALSLEELGTDARQRKELVERAIVVTGSTSVIVGLE